MRRFIFVMMLLISAILLLNSFSPAEKTTSEEAAPYKASLLVAYGEEVYNRENCASCHTMQVSDESSELISLDGVGRKYPYSWLYEYLNEPRRFIPQSKKRGYKELYRTPLNSEFVSVKKKSKAWKTLLKEAGIIQADLLKYGITSEKTEILALLAYIQQITPSKEKSRLDSIANQEVLAKYKVWDDLFSDDASIIVALANDESNSEKGRSVYEDYCSACHGRNGEGGVGPNLTDEYWLTGGTKLEIAKAIIYGNPKKGMIAWYSILTPQEVGELVSFISSIKGSNPKNAKVPQGTRE